MCYKFTIEIINWLSTIHYVEDHHPTIACFHTKSGRRCSEMALCSHLDHSSSGTTCTWRISRCIHSWFLWPEYPPSERGRSQGKWWETTFCFCPSCSPSKNIHLTPVWHKQKLYLTLQHTTKIELNQILWLLLKGAALYETSTICKLKQFEDILVYLCSYDNPELDTICIFEFYISVTFFF